MANDEVQLLRSARDGDPKAIEQLLANHEEQIFRFGLRMCGNEADARDVLQDTLLAAFKNLHEFRGESQLSSWLYQIARSFCSRSRRRTAGEPDRLESLDQNDALAVPSEDRQPEALAHAREIGAVMQAAILGLSASEREVIVLRDIEGLTAEEAAAALGIEVGALKSRLHRARAELREKLAGVLEPESGEGEACPELARELASYAQAEIDQAACATIERHLASCPRCAAACGQLKRTVTLCSALPGGKVPSVVRSAVRKALREAIG